MIDNKYIKFNPYHQCRVKLTEIGASAINCALKRYTSDVESDIIYSYTDDYTGQVDLNDLDLIKSIKYIKTQYPQRYKQYKKNDYYEDCFDFIVDIIIKHLVYNKWSFSNIFCYIGDGIEDETWFEVESL